MHEAGGHAVLGELGDESLAQLAPPTGDDHGRRALGGGGPRHAGADTGGGTVDEDDLAVQEVAGGDHGSPPQIRASFLRFLSLALR